MGSEEDNGINMALGRALEAAVKNDINELKEILATSRTASGSIQKQEDLSALLSETLLEAACHGQTGCMRVLIEAGADMNGTSSVCWTPLHYAAYSGQQAACSLLIELGADLEIKNQEGETPLDLAKRNTNQAAAGLIEGAILAKQEKQALTKYLARDQNGDDINQLIENPLPTARSIRSL